MLMVAILATAASLAVALGVAHAITVTAPSAAASSYLVNAAANYTFSGMKTTNNPKETISNQTTSTVITFPSNFVLTGITGVSIPGLSATGQFSVSGQTISIKWASNVNRNRTFTVVISGLQNTSQPGSAATYSIDGTITSNTSATKVLWRPAAAFIGNATAVTAVTSVLDTSAISAPSTYTVGFTLGAQGRIAGTTTAGGNTITITFPAGTTVPAGPMPSNVTINGVAPSAVSVSGQAVTLTMPAGTTIVGGQAVTVVLKRAFGLVNPATIGNAYQVGISTSAETGVGMSAPYTIALAVPTNVNLASSNQPAAGFALPGQTVVVDGFSLQRTLGSTPATVSAVSVTDAGTAPATTVSGVRAYQDNGDGVFGAGDVLLNSTPATFVGTAAAVSFDAGKLQTISDSLPHQYWVVYSFGAGSVNGDTASSQVTTFTATASLSSIPAGKSATFTIDAIGPTTAWADPSVDATTITDVPSTVIGGTSADTGSGVGSVVVKIQRGSDGLWWNGAAWAASPTSMTAAATLNWTFGWDLLPTNQDGTDTYTLYATGIDTLGNVGPTAVRSGIMVDNRIPTLVSAVALDATHVDATFSEPLAPTSSAVLLAAMSFDNGLSATAATLDANGITVHLTTGAQVIGVNYTLTVAIESLSNALGILNEAPNTALFLSGAVPTVVVTQGTDPGRPLAEVFMSHDATAVVDEIVLSASGGPATAATVTVRGLDTFATLRADVAKISLFRDNGDKVFGPGDTRVSTASTFSADASGTALTFASIGSVVVPGSPASFWIVYKSGSTPGNGHEVGSRLKNGDVAVTTATVPAFATITSANSGKTVQIDIVPPSVPATVAANAVATGSVEVTWTPSADAISGVAFYDIYRDGSFIATSTSTTYTATGLTAGQNYSFSVSAVDAAGNESAQSAAVAVTPPAGAIWMTITTPGADLGVDLGNLSPGTASATTSGTTVAVGGVGAYQYDLSVDAQDFDNQAPSVPPTMPASVMSYATRGWVVGGPAALSIAPQLIASSTGTKYTWLQSYIFDYDINVGYQYSPGVYTSHLTFTVVQN